MSVRLFARIASALALLVTISTLAARPLHAQGSLDIIVGKVTDATGKPVAGAVVEAFSIETEVTRRATTNDKGTYQIIFQDGTGQYRISVKAIGKTPQIYNVARQSDDDRAFWSEYRITQDRLANLFLHLPAELVAVHD